MSSANPQTIPPPDTITTPVIVERTEILKYIAKRLSELTPEKPPTHVPDFQIINYYGTQGCGKTALIEQVFRLLSTTYRVILLDFAVDRPVSITPEYRLDQVLQELRQLPALAMLPDTIVLDANPNQEQPAANFTLRFATRGPALTDTRPLIVLLDHIDTIPYWRWLQEALLKPLQERQPTLVICASRTVLYWHFWELREKCKPEQLPMFSLAETQHFLQGYAHVFDGDLLATSAQAITAGHPWQLQRLMDFLATGKGFPKTVPPEELADRIAQCSDVTQTILRYTCLLRHFDIQIMAEVIATLDLDLPTEQPLVHLIRNQVLPELSTQGLLEPYRRGQSYRLFADHRATLRAQLCTAEPGRCTQIYLLLEESYQKRFITRPIDEQSAFNEWAYCSTDPDHGLWVRDIPYWQAQIDTMFSRVRLVGKQLAVKFYKDGELIQRLQTLGLFTEFRDRFRQSLADDTSMPPLLNSSELEQYRRELIAILNRQFEDTSIKEIRGGLTKLLKIIDMFADEFDLPALHRQFKQWVDPQIRPGTIHQAVALLSGEGLVIYDPERKKYKTSSLITLLNPNRLHLPISEPAHLSRLQSVVSGR